MKKIKDWGGRGLRIDILAVNVTFVSTIRCFSRSQQLTW
jgi:hypothetical protein